jgi:hypothetical protein
MPHGLTAHGTEIHRLGDEFEEALDITTIAHRSSRRHQHRGPGGNAEANRLRQRPSSAQANRNRGYHRVAGAHATARTHLDRRNALSGPSRDQQRTTVTERYHDNLRLSTLN